MKLLLLAVTLAACANDAITLAHSIDPSAECTEIHGDSSTDTATCRAHGHSWFCISTRGFSGCLEGESVVHHIAPEAP